MLNTKQGENKMTKQEIADQIYEVLDQAHALAEKDGYGNFPNSIFTTKNVAYIAKAIDVLQQQAQELKKQQQVIEAIKNPPLSRSELEKNIVERIKNRHSGSSHRYPQANDELQDVMWAIEGRWEEGVDDDDRIIDAITQGPWGCDTDSAVMLEHEDMELLRWIDDYKPMLVESYPTIAHSGEEA